MSGVAGATRKKVQRKFKMGGYTLKVDALNEVLSFLSNYHFQDEDEALNLLIDQIHLQTLKSSILDREPVHHAISLLLAADAAVTDEENPSGSSSGALRIIDTFIIPKFHYDSVKKVFHELSGFSSARGQEKLELAELAPILLFDVGL